jgi:hypothetical protein
MIPLHRNPSFYQLLTDSYARALGLPLVPQAMTVVEASEWLYESAPFAVLAHNSDLDPLFTLIYGNKAAQRRFEYSWDEITRLPSRLSAEAPNREERQQFLARVQRLGSDGHSNVGSAYTPDLRGGDHVDPTSAFTGLVSNCGTAPTALERRTPMPPSSACVGNLGTRICSNEQ